MACAVLTAGAMRFVLPLLSLLCLAPSAVAQRIVIDPGHGGGDPGAVGCGGLEEAPTVLDVAQQLQVLLEGEGLTVDLTREDDREVSLSARTAFANSRNATLFVSIHSNSNAGTAASGTETFVATSPSAASRSLGTYLQDEMIDAWMLPDRGLKQANFYVVVNTRMPAALTELAFTNRCEPDARLLRDPNARHRIARAQARAILRQLGRDPDDLDGPPSTEGVLLGAVFEDIGAGLEDTSRRIGGATVSIDGTVRVPTTPDNGIFRFSVPAGTYVVAARAAGFEQGMRTCEVTAGSDTWCSVGLRRPAAMMPTDAGMPLDAGAIDAGVDAGSIADAGAPAEDAGALPDAGRGSIPPRDAASANDASTRPDTADGGCAAGPNRPTPLAPVGLLAFVALLGARRRRSTAIARPKPHSWIDRAAPIAHRTSAPFVLALLVLGCSSNAPPAPVTAPAVEALAIANERAIGPGLSAPVFSPDGLHLAVSSPDHGELFLATLADGSLEAIAQGPRVGYRPVFDRDGRQLRYRHPEQSPTAVPHHAVAIEAAAVHALPVTRRVWLDEQQQVVLQDERGARVISPPGDRYLAPELAADERHVAMWGMTSGILLYRVADHALVRFGDGGHPSFDPNGGALVFDRTEDDGHRLTAGDLFRVDLRDGRYRAVQLTEGPRIEREPAIAGTRIAFTTDEGVLVGEVVPAR